MSNVVHFRGDMHPRNALRIGKLTEDDIDSQIAANRSRYDEACEAEAMGLPVSTRRTPSLIPLDNSLFARAIRALRWALQLKGPL